MIGHSNLAPLDVGTLQKIYLGKVIEVAGIPVTAVNADSGSSVRNHFLQTFFNENEDNIPRIGLCIAMTGSGRRRANCRAAPILSIL